jgi:hypothetical protein
MTTVACIVALYGQVDAHMHGLPNQPHATVWPSEVVTLGVRHALTGVGHRAFSRGLTRDPRAWFPRLPERPRRFRRFLTPQAGTAPFWASPTGLGVIATSGLEVIHPIREGRSPRPIGRTGLAKPRWLVGGNVCRLLNQWGWVGAWEGATATVSDQPLPPLLRPCAAQMMVRSETAFPAAEGDPTHLKRGRRGAWKDRLRIATVWSLRTVVSPGTQVMHRVWEYVQARLACTMAALHRLVHWHGLPTEEPGFVPLSIAEFSLSDTSTID